jgi:5,10-methylenetetrahydromethanopterin reductase
MLEQFGRDPAGVRPAPRLREAHAAMRALLDDGSVDAVGEFGAYAGVFTMARPVAERVPLLLGAMGGPLTFRVAGEVADGESAPARSRARPSATSSTTSGSVPSEPAGVWRSLDLCASLTVAVADDREAALRAARLKAAFYLPSMPAALIERHGVPFTEIEPINAAFSRGDVGEALRLTPDDLADRFCIAGTPEEVAERIRADVMPAGFGHVALALADAAIPQAWAGVEIPGLPRLSEQVRLIGERVVPLLG